MIHWLRRHAPQTAAQVAWRREILPFQWRISVSWMSGYFIFQLFTPMLFTNQGAVAANANRGKTAIKAAVVATNANLMVTENPSTRVVAALARNLSAKKTTSISNANPSPACPAAKECL